MANKREVAQKEEEEPLMVQDLSSYELRLALRQHVIILAVAVLMSLVAWILPSETWWWWLIKAALLLPALFIGLVRFFMLNGARNEIERRARASSGRVKKGEGAAGVKKEKEV